MKRLVFSFLLVFCLFLGFGLLVASDVKMEGDAYPQNQVYFQDIEKSPVSHFLCQDGLNISAYLKTTPLDVSPAADVDFFMAYPSDCINEDDGCPVAIYAVSYTYSGRVDIYGEDQKWKRKNVRLESFEIKPGQVKWTSTSYHVRFDKDIEIYKYDAAGKKIETPVVLKRANMGFNCMGVLFLDHKEVKTLKPSFNENTVFSIGEDDKDYRNEIASMLIVKKYPIDDLKEDMNSTLFYGAIVYQNSFKISDTANPKVKVFKKPQLKAGQLYYIYYTVYDSKRNLIGGSIMKAIYRP